MFSQYEIVLNMWDATNMTCQVMIQWSQDVHSVGSSFHISPSPENTFRRSEKFGWNMQKVCANSDPTQIDAISCESVCTDHIVSKICKHHSYDILQIDSNVRDVRVK